MNTFFRQFKLILATSPIFIAALLSGCSSSSSSSGTAVPTATVQITGTAAAGAPVVGYVSVRDSSTKPQPVKTNIPIEANGHYSVDVTGLTAPYAFLATGTVGGRTVSLYSAATSADKGKTINITPFTDLIIRNIAATAVDAYLNNPANMANLTTAQLDAKRVALTTLLSPALIAMGVSGSIDLLRATFNADNTGLDRFMDVVKVSTTSTTATITNVLDAANTLIINTTTGTPTGALSTTNLSASATPLDGMVATTKAFSVFFATSLPSPTTPALVALFSNSFLEDGRGAPAFLTEITTNSATFTGLKFTNVVMDSIDATGNIIQMHFTPVNTAGELLARDQKGGAIGWQMIKNGSGVWQFDGNQRIARVKVNTTASHHVCNPAFSACNWASTYTTGLSLEIDNKGLLPIGWVLVTGNGLPNAGVTLTAPANQTWFNITTTNPNTLCTNCSGNDWIMSDAEIGLVTPDSVYTITLYDNSGASGVLATYTDVVPVAPVLNTAVASLAYPTITAGMVNLAGTGATNLPLTWSIPAGLWGDWMSVSVWQTITNQNLNVGTDIMKPTGTATLAITAPTNAGTWTSGNYWINAWDQYGGKVNTNYQ